MVISTMGPWAIAVISAKGLAGSEYFNAAIYFFLHFQYNGWFAFAIIGLFFWLLGAEAQNQYKEMQEAVPVGVGAMAAILGLDFETVKAVAEEAAQGEICQAANDNDPGQVVVSGHKDAVERATVIAKEKGAKRALLLPVSAPFHCALMAPAAAAMAQALSDVAINAPAVPLVANVVASAVTDPATIRSLLVEQVTGSVRWRESVGYMAAQGVTEIYEIGAGKALCGMVKRIDRTLTATAVGTPENVTAAAAVLNA